MPQGYFNDGAVLPGSLVTGNGGALMLPKPQTTKFYLASSVAGFTGTNTTLLVTDTLYAVLAFASAPVRISKIGVRTSSSNASVGAAIKVAIYECKADGTPGARLGTAVAGTAITDSAASTDFTITLDSVVNLPAGPFYIAVLGTAATTGARLTILNTSFLSAAALGAATQNGIYATSPIFGYSLASQAYASGPPATFSGGTAITSINFAPAFVYGVA